MRGLGALLFSVGAVLAYFMVVDRQSAIALDLVEALPNGAWGGLMGLGVLLVGIDIGRGLLAGGNQSQDRPIRKAPERLKLPKTAPQSRDAILAKARTFIGSGARLEADIEGVPITLTFEHAAPGAIKRTVERLGGLMMEIPRPPRVRLRFIQCPDGGAPRHHQVAGALATHLSRSEFKASQHMDAVEIMFFHPDASWREIWG
ncbi:MAG: hypothetical protein GY913_34715 [Proteobacteria bacterium]|nr:hypothetical protein [Pseudomonadota bacterium]MCP4922084.1 hypothetical protein [Pseudomonadota bacterium]